MGSLTGLELINRLDWLVNKHRDNPACVSQALGLQVYTTITVSFSVGTGTRTQVPMLLCQALYLGSHLPSLFSFPLHHAQTVLTINACTQRTASAALSVHSQLFGSWPQRRAKESLVKPHKPSLRCYKVDWSRLARQLRLTAYDSPAACGQAAC